MTKKYLTLDDLTELDKGDFSVVGYYGSCIDADGKIYHLKYRYIHAKICGLLYPDILKEYGLEPPNSDSETMDFQAFEGRMNDRLPVIRFATSMMGYDYLSFSTEIVPTREQVYSLKKLIKNMNYTNEKFQTDSISMTGQDFCNWLESRLINSL